MGNDPQAKSGAITRRSLLGTAAAIAATPALAEEYRLGPPPHEKGAKVWMDMDQVELDAAYDQSLYAPTSDQFRKRFASISETTRKRLGLPRRFAYGPTAIEALDVYPAKSANAPIFVFIHGGRWRYGQATSWPEWPGRAQADEACLNAAPGVRRNASRMTRCAGASK